MTKPVFQDPDVEQWFIELESVIRHEILSYIVDCKANEEGLWMWDGLSFIDTLNAGIDCAFNYLDRLLELDSDLDAIELEGTIGSGTSLEQAERFLEEKDFLIQVIDKNDINKLSYEAQYRLAVTYPLAKETIKYYIQELNGYELPSCLRSMKLNDDFRINNLWENNNIPEIAKFHLHLLDRKKQKKIVNMTKPQLITSVKRNQYIDIYPARSSSSSESYRDLELITKYKWGIINELEEPYRSEIIIYCNKLVQVYIQHLSDYEHEKDNLTPEYTSLPVPPPKKLYVTRYDGYLPLLIGLYCVKNEHRYKEVANRELEVEFDSFRDFLEEELYIKFDCLRERYESWFEQKIEDQVVDLKVYIDDVLSKSVKANITSVKLLISEIEKEYFCR